MRKAVDGASSCSCSNPRLTALAQLSDVMGTATSEEDLAAAVAGAVEVLFGPAHIELDLGAEGVSRRPQLHTGSTLAGPRIAAPMMIRGHTFGVLAVERPRGAPEFAVSDLETLVGVAGQYGLALSELRRDVTLRRLELTGDLAEASEIQRRFLPSVCPQFLELSVTYRPACDVSGDFYDLMLDPRGRAIVVIGDVSGSGVSAALIMSHVSAELHRIAPTAGCASCVLSALNGFAVASLPDHDFVTAQCLVIDPFERTVAVANAGHVPLLLRRGGGGVDVYGEDAGVPLGVSPHGVWNEERFAITDDDVLLLSTDGVVEGMNPERNPSGLQQVAEIVRALPPDVNAINRGVLQALDAAPHHQDDVTLIALRLSGSRRRELTSSRRRTRAGGTESSAR